MASATTSSADEPPVFELANIQKSYGRFRALNDVSFRIEKGHIGLLGPNGAGKSTLIKVLLGILQFDSGSARVLGYEIPRDNKALRSKVGFMPENDSYLPYLSAVDYVKYAGELCGMPPREAFRRAHEVLEYVGLVEARYRKLEGFSTGMKQRVKLAQALVHGPKLVFLDEPTNGLDPKGRVQMLNLLKDVKARGIYFVLSSHILPDVEEICDHVILLNKGELVFENKIGAVYEENKLSFTFDSREQNPQFIQLLKQAGYSVDSSGMKPKILVRDLSLRHEILKIAVDNNIILRQFEPTELSLETAFLQLLNKE